MTHTAATAGRRRQRALGQVTPVALALFLAFGVWSAYRMWVPVRRLDLFTPSVLHAESELVARVVSSGLAPVTVRLELVQGAHAETLNDAVITGHRHAFWDPRVVPATVGARLTSAVLARFQRGPAVVRATGSGRSRWHWVPPPVVREAPVEIRHDTSSLN